jgi:hypothetical protein
MPNPGAASSRPKIASLQARLGRPVDLGAVTVEGLLYLNSAEKRQSEQELAKTRFVVDVQAKLHAQQAQNNSLSQFSASPDLHNEFLSAVIGAMDSSADLSAQILNKPELAQKLLGELVPIIYKELKATA